MVEQSINQILMELRQIKQLLGLEKPIWTFSEFCLFADLSEDYVRKLHRDGRIPFYRPFGKKLYITKLEAIKLLMQNPVSNQEQINAHLNQHFLNSKKVA